MKFFRLCILFRSDSTSSMPQGEMSAAPETLLDALGFDAPQEPPPTTLVPLMEVKLF